jgi:micrococcal nuclease
MFNFYSEKANIEIIILIPVRIGLNTKSTYKMKFCCFGNGKSIESIESIADAPWLTLKDEYLKCKIIKVYDGDTVHVIFPFGGTFFKKQMRLAGIDAPELRTKNLVEKKVAIDVRDWLCNKICDKIVWIKFDDWDKYGRLLGTIFLNSKNINDELIEKNMVCKYTGGTKTPFDKWWYKK